ncbi:hypothetical protein OH77DRAFT_1418279 [Trametes cingulata]|nr:hypothetical protein OH77DRAFT_1418279 [Trametes cingulata]
MAKVIPRQAPQPALPLIAAYDWYARDHDVETPVYLVVEPLPASSSVQGSRWSIAWRVGGLTEDAMTGWCYLRLRATPVSLVDQGDPPHYGYHGPMTESGSPTANVKRYKIGNTTLAARIMIQEMAAKTAIVPADDTETLEKASQNWIQRLLHAMVTKGFIAEDMPTIIAMRVRTEMGNSPPM